MQNLFDHINLQFLRCIVANLVNDCKINFEVVSCGKHRVDLKKTTWEIVHFNIPHVI
jgi:hypothetical protein